MSDEVLEAAEKSVANLIGSSFSGVTPAPVVEPAKTPAVAEEPMEIQPFDFEADFQTKIAAHAVRDQAFARRVSHLLRPEFFENVGQATLVNICLQHYKKYGDLPDKTIVTAGIKAGIASKAIRVESFPEVKRAMLELYSLDLRNREFVEDEIVRFARHQMMGAAILKSIPLRERGEFEKIEKLVKEAIDVGATNDGDGYEYFARIAERTEIRLDAAAGKRPPVGITTGIKLMDDLLYHGGWGRKELSSIMGGAKAGKTTALINFAKAASLAGHNVLYATLEVGAPIISERLDACVAEVFMKELKNNIHAVREKVEQSGKKAGQLILHEYPSGTLTPNMLRALIDRYRSPTRRADGTERPPVKFDLIVVDYADIMAPNYRTQDTIENSKSVYVDLRAIAFEENAAVLTATQTNREGFKSAVAKAEHVAEDFNKVRTVDLMISINKTEEEAKRGEARLYFAASRNQESGFTIMVKQNLAMMKFVEQVIGVE